MTCPVCGGKTTVMYCIKENDANHRKRKCNECGHVFFTEEYEAITSDRFYELMREFERKRRENGKNKRK